MLFISSSNCIRCYFSSESKTTSKFDSGKLEVFYAKTKDLNSRYLDLKTHITNVEKSIADKFHFDKDRETYISCHALLRLIIAKKLNTKPLKIIFKNETNKKPYLPGNPLYFNITHTREAFAFGISKHLYVGIDLEKINLRMDFYSIIETFFSNREREFILQSQSGARNRFFLLWTRKEALLKALGIGIINTPPQVEVCEQENFIDKKLVENLVSDSAFTEYLIYSKKLCNHYLSIATPNKASINLYHLDKENIASYLD